MENKNKLGQAFSADVLIVVVIVLFGVLFIVMNKINSMEVDNIDKIYDEASLDSKAILSGLKEKQIIDSENKVDSQKLLSLNEEELKEELGIRNDFAIVFEKDGKLIKLDSQTNITCLGSPNILVNGVACK